MSYILRISAFALPTGLLVATLPMQLGAQPGSRPSSGMMFGVALGVSRVSLRALPTLPAVNGTDIALGWHVGYQTSTRFAIKFAASSSVYRYPGPGRARKRGFETLMPMLEYRVDDRLRLSAGAGLQMDAPVFYDLRPSSAGERTFHHGLGAVFGLSYALRAGQRYSPDVQARYNVGYANVPQGRVVGQTGALLIGVRRDPMAPSVTPPR